MCLAISVGFERYRRAEVVVVSPQQVWRSSVSLGWLAVLQTAWRGVVRVDLEYVSLPAQGR